MWTRDSRPLRSMTRATAVQCPEPNCRSVIARLPVGVDIAVKERTSESLIGKCSSCGHGFDIPVVRSDG